MVSIEGILVSWAIRGPLILQFSQVPAVLSKRLEISNRNFYFTIPPASDVAALGPLEPVGRRPHRVAAGHIQIHKSSMECIAGVPSMTACPLAPRLMMAEGRPHPGIVIGDQNFHSCGSDTGIAAVLLEPVVLASSRTQ